MQTLPLRRILPDDPPDAFPDPARALREPDGLLAVGGDLSTARLLYAYRHGIFPWYDAGLPILWWSPDPRALFFPGSLHVSRSLMKRMRRGGYEIRYDTAFSQVMQACAGPRPHYPGGGTWLNMEMQAAYQELHRLGHAHSAELWVDGELKGGLYGVAMGRIFFGESMYSHVTDASKIVLVELMHDLEDWGYACMDCQVQSEHLVSMGSVPVPRTEFLKMLEALCDQPVSAQAWRSR
ncbi:MAG TPA: leucyl/phenylalanyl-tRNA--protein transferase [Gammaproteobacteria bacterium]|nr:leucyl/phenylalanyl-tRNA--protein transferase [Gammaproteobacteria bacterium]